MDASLRVFSSRRSHGKRAVAASVLRIALAIALPAIMAGCATPVTPPPVPSDAVTVYLADYGRHSSITMPTSDGQLVEYTYGDWEFYALNKARWDLGVFKLIFTGRACLGRRVMPPVAGAEGLRRALGARRVIALAVRRADMEALRDELGGRFHRQAHTLVYSAAHDACFVMDDSRYWLFNTCNNETARWLRKLGCRVPGVPVLSNFRVESPAEPPRR